RIAHSPRSIDLRRRAPRHPRALRAVPRGGAHAGCGRGRRSARAFRRGREPQGANHTAHRAPRGRHAHLAATVARAARIRSRHQGSAHRADRGTPLPRGQPRGRGERRAQDPMSPGAAFLRKLRAFSSTGVALFSEYRAELLLWSLAGVIPLIMMGVWREASATGAFPLDPTEFTRYFLAVFFVRQATIVWVIWDFETH